LLAKSYKIIKYNKILFIDPISPKNALCVSKYFNEEIISYNDFIKYISRILLEKNSDSLSTLIKKGLKKDTIIEDKTIVEHIFINGLFDCIDVMLLEDKDALPLLILNAYRFNKKGIFIHLLQKTNTEILDPLMGLIIKKMKVHP
jgi:hypothetical protein